MTETQGTQVLELLRLIWACTLATAVLVGYVAVVLSRRP